MVVPRSSAHDNVGEELRLQMLEDDLQLGWYTPTNQQRELAATCGALNALKNGKASKDYFKTYRRRGKRQGKEANVYELKKLVLRQEVPSPV